jgi:NitT/TauT family transport system substrate-binding protein
VRYGLNTTGIDVAPVWIARDQGFFEKYGIDAELVTLPADQLVAAIISGEMAMTNLAGTPVVSAGLAGTDLTFYGSYSSVLWFPLYAQPGITSVHELRGKEIAITSRAGVVKRTAELILQRNGMNSEGDTTLIATGNNNNALGALLSGHVAAAILSPPATFRAQDEGMRLLVDTAEYQYPTILAGIAASRAWVGRNEEVARGTLQAIAEGVAFAVQQKERTKEIIARYLQNDDPELLERSYNAQALGWDRTLLVPPEAIRLELESVAQDNPAGLNARPEQFYDNRLIDELERQGFFRRLWP